MDSFHRSRARVSFEAVCALGLSASFVAAWMQTFASAFLPAAGIAALYAVVHALGMVGRKPVAAPTGDTTVSTSEPKPAADAPPEATQAEAAEPAEPASSPDKPARKARAAAPKKPKAARTLRPAEPPRVEDATVLQLHRQEEAPAADAAFEQPEVAEDVPSDDVAHLPVAPLFEPEPFVRQQRTVFGRKSGY